MNKKYLQVVFSTPLEIDLGAVSKLITDLSFVVLSSTQQKVKNWKFKKQNELFCFYTIFNLETVSIEIDLLQTTLRNHIKDLFVLRIFSIPKSFHIDKLMSKINNIYLEKKDDNEKKDDTNGRIEE